MERDLIQYENHPHLHCAGVSGGAFAVPAQFLSLHADLLALHDSGGAEARCAQRRLAGPQTHCKLPPMGRAWV